MSDLQIKITTPAELAGAKAVEQQLERDIGKAKALGQEYDHLEKQLKQVRGVIGNYGGDLQKTGQETDSLNLKQGRFLEGLKKSVRELPLAGVAIDLLKNPLTAAGFGLAWAASKVRELTESLKEMVSNSQEAGDKFKISADKFSDHAAAIEKVAAALKDMAAFSKAYTDGLEAQNAAIEENIAAIGQQLEAEAELAKLKLDRDQPDPVKRAQGHAEIENVLALRKLGLASKKGQQAAIVEAQIKREQELQVAAGEAVPRRADLVAAVSTFDSDRQSLEQAAEAKHAAFNQAELLRRFLREAKAPDIIQQFAPSDIRSLLKMGVLGGVTEVFDTGTFTGFPSANEDRAREMLSGASTQYDTARERHARATSAFNASRGALPAGIATMQDIDPFLSKAEAEAAGVQTESWKRSQSLLAKRDSLERGQRNDAALGRVSVEATEVKGAIGVNEATEAKAKERADRERRVLNEFQGTSRSNNEETINLLHDTLEDLRFTRSELSTLKAQMRTMKAQNQRGIE